MLPTQYEIVSAKIKFQATTINGNFTEEVSHCMHLDVLFPLGFNIFSFKFLELIIQAPQSSPQQGGSKAT